MYEAMRPRSEQNVFTFRKHRIPGNVRTFPTIIVDHIVIVAPNKPSEVQFQNRGTKLQYDCTTEVFVRLDERIKSEICLRIRGEI